MPWRTPLRGVPRPSDPEFLIHSTTHEVWEEIRSAGEMRAAAYLPERWNLDDEDNETNRYLRSEPPEYREYIMFGGMTGSSELVLASYRARKFIMDENAEYRPGVRIYVKNYEIIKDKIGIRDGIHTMKACAGE